MATVVVSTPSAAARAIRFVRHLLEMTAAMMLGMFALGALVAVTGGDLLELRLNHPSTALLLMASSMSVPMVGWMRYRGHGWKGGAEMSVAMFVPAVGLIACYWLGGVSAEPMCPLACAAMIPSMVVAMLLRLDAYTRPFSAHT
jgi:hypothetical protein